MMEMESQLKLKVFGLLFPIGKGKQTVADCFVHGDISKVKLVSIIPSYGIKFSMN
jgi:hypothetical protein